MITANKFKMSKFELPLANILTAFGITLSIAEINDLLTTFSLLVALGMNIHIILKRYGGKKDDNTK